MDAGVDEMHEGVGAAGVEGVSSGGHCIFGEFAREIGKAWKENLLGVCSGKFGHGAICFGTNASVRIVEQWEENGD